MDSPQGLRAPSDEPRRYFPEDFVSGDGMALIWMNAILLVPLIFGVMFLPPLIRAMVLSLAAGIAATYGILYAYARLHPTSAGAHLLQILHVGPRRPVTR